MPIYISLGRYTREGAMEIKKMPERLEQARKIVEAQGGKILAFYTTFGRYDFVIVCEGPNDESALKAIMAIVSQGAVKLETLKAFPAEEVAKILKELP